MVNTRLPLLVKQAGGGEEKKTIGKAVLQQDKKNYVSYISNVYQFNYHRKSETLFLI